jgi:hypothetical protein
LRVIDASYFLPSEDETHGRNMRRSIFPAPSSWT